jgi:hypothetical protein
MRSEQRSDARRKFGYYMRAKDYNTNELLGYLSDISTAGFRLESQRALTVNREYAVKLELTSEISEMPYIVFVARVLWIRQDPINPNDFIAGFQIVRISPYEHDIFNRIMQKYGRLETKY